MECCGLCAHKSLKRSYSCMLMCRVGQHRIYTPCMSVYLVIYLPKVPYMHHIYMVLANPTHVAILE
jgi:hypothetical protein